MAQKRDKTETEKVFGAMDWKAYAIVFVLLIVEFVLLIWLPWMYGIPMALSDSAVVFLIVAALTFLAYIYLQDRRLRMAMRKK